MGQTGCLAPRQTVRGSTNSLHFARHAFRIRRIRQHLKRDKATFNSTRQHLRSLGSVSRGLGALQRRILGALVDRRDSDFYDASKVPDFVDPTDIPWIRARWRWYTLDLVDLAHFGDPRSERVSLRRAVHGLARTRRLETATSCPYDQPFAAWVNDFGEYFGGIDLNELRTVDPRWPSQGRCLWFRLPLPPSLD